MQLEIPFNAARGRVRLLEILRKNEQNEAYLRPLVFFGDGVMGLNPAKATPSG